jgi:hypothetical protein
VSALAHRVVTSMILVNLPVAAWVELTHDELAERVDAGILLFFACEVAVRVVLAVKRREGGHWLILDGLIICLALTPLGVAPIARTARLAHLGRHVQHLRHATVGRLAHV